MGNQHSVRIEYRSFEFHLHDIVRTEVRRKIIMDVDPGTSRWLAGILAGLGSNPEPDYFNAQYVDEKIVLGALAKHGLHGGPVESGHNYFEVILSEPRKRNIAMSEKRGP